MTAPDLDTLPLHDQMRLAADVLERANARYVMPPNAPWRAGELRHEARHVEDEHIESTTTEGELNTWRS